MLSYRESAGIHFVMGALFNGFHPLKALVSVEQITISRVYFANLPAYLFHDHDHLRIEITDSIDLERVIASVFFLHHFRKGGDDGPVQPFPLMFGNNAEYQSLHFPVCLSPGMP